MTPESEAPAAEPRKHKPQQWWMGLRKRLNVGKRHELKWLSPTWRQTADEQTIYLVKAPLVRTDRDGKIIDVRFPPWRRLTPKLARPGARRRERIRAERADWLS